MNNEQEQTMAAFVQWLPQNIQQFEGSLPKEIIEPIATAQSPEEVVNVLNQLSQSQEGNQVVSAMFQAFQESQKTGMFAKGGKLNYLLNKNITFAQDGTKIRRRDAMQMAMGAGLSRSQARTALANANNAVGRDGAEMVYNSFKDKQINPVQPIQPERRILSTPTPQVAAPIPNLSSPSNFEDFGSQREERKNAALEEAYDNIMAGKWGNGHDIRAQHAANMGLNYNDVRSYVNAHAPRQTTILSENTVNQTRPVSTMISDTYQAPQNMAQAMRDVAADKSQPWLKRAWNLINSGVIANIPFNK